MNRHIRYVFLKKEWNKSGYNDSILVCLRRHVHMLLYTNNGSDNVFCREKVCSSESTIPTTNSFALVCVVFFTMDDGFMKTINDIDYCYDNDDDHQRTSSSLHCHFLQRLSEGKPRRKEKTQTFPQQTKHTLLPLFTRKMFLKKPVCVYKS